MNAEQMTRAERIQYHVTRRDAAIRQAQVLAEGWHGEGLGQMVDRLAYDHAKDAAHAAQERGER